ncbi:LCP family protein [Clostridium fallax]|uniref:Transcriptional attenuator, LytR family n=1 Tax=Clostridium fallax TaxID=1533 RepID=A0A1M4VNJ3_9CLOT|nr:LCP family protein [Clostridium fallax]SHE70417.1 transcriptional attenuator, LytR family [Clostridium fallax]SQB22807.1 cell envelope-like transcriptional attenuator domain-containing protein [Clostridium fallax]
MGYRVDRAKRRKKKRKSSKLKKFMMIIIPIILIIAILIMGLGYYYIKKVKNVGLDEGNLSVTDVSKIDLDSNQKAHKVKNILLLGVDEQEKASDSIMVLSIDETTKKIKLTSLMRDTYVDFGKGKITKLNYAYHYGGEQLSVKTVNEKFKLDITDYIKVDFNGLAHIIDYVGGIEVDVKPEEVKYVNSYAKNISDITKMQYTPISKSGPQVLNGEQATAYCRIRYVGNNDYQRTERQRNILTKIFDKLIKSPITDYPNIVNQLAPYATTSLNTFEVLKLAVAFAGYTKNGIEQSRCPYDGLREDTMINNIYYMKWNEPENVKKLHQFIYAQ